MNKTRHSGYKVLYDDNYQVGLSLDELKKNIIGGQAGTRVIRFSMDILDSSGVIKTVSCDFSDELEHFLKEYDRRVLQKRANQNFLVSIRKND